MSKYDERLYEQFQKEQGTFHRWLLAGLFLSVFYGLVFQPYLTVLTNLSELDLQQLETDKQIKSTEMDIQTATYAIDRATGFMGDASEYQGLYDDANSWVDNLDDIEQISDLQSRRVVSLRDSLSSALQEKWQIGKVPSANTITLLKDLRPELMTNFKANDNCFFRLETDWVACQVERKRKPINDKLFRVLYDRSVAHEYTALLKAEIESNKKMYRTNLPSALSEAGLKQWVRGYLDEEKMIIRKWYQDMAGARQDLVSKSQLHQQAQKAHLLAKDSLDQRKLDFSQTGEINTPIGPIKLGFHDLISLVPFLALCILSVLINSTCRQLILRSTFQINGPKDETTHEALSLTMPIWLEPFKSRLYNALRLVGLVLLMMTALIGLWQVVTNPGLEVAEVKLHFGFIIIGTMLATIIFALRLVHLIASVYRKQG
jgi:hypothetical protein